MKPDIEELRRKYMDNPPEGMTSMDIRRMSEDELLDMDYFLNDDELDDDFGKNLDMTILIEKEYFYGSCKGTNSTDYLRKQH